MMRRMIVDFEELLQAVGLNPLHVVLPRCLPSHGHGFNVVAHISEATGEREDTELKSSTFTFWSTINKLIA